MTAQISAMDYRRIETRPLTPTIGAEIHGVDLSQPLDEATREEIRAAFLQHQVIFFRGQDIDLEQHKAFGRVFGELHIHPASPGPEGHPEILIIHADENSTYVAGNAWHSDVSCDPEPPLGSILHMHTVPPTGGDTMFCNQYLAYEALSDAMKAMLDGMRAKFSGTIMARRTGHIGEVPFTYHPIVRTHPDTGRKALFLSHPDTVPSFENMTEGESRPLLDYLYAHCPKPDRSYRHQWRQGDVVMWDNRSLMHYAICDYDDQPRYMERTTAIGDRPV